MLGISNNRISLKILSVIITKDSKGSLPKLYLHFFYPRVSSKSFSQFLNSYTHIRNVKSIKVKGHQTGAQ